VEQPVGDRGDDPVAGLAAPQVDPGLGALAEDHLGQRLPEQFRLRAIQVRSREFLLAVFQPRGPGTRSPLATATSRNPAVDDHAEASSMPIAAPHWNSGRSGGVMPETAAARRKAFLPCVALISYAVKISRVVWDRQTAAYRGSCSRSSA